MIIPKRGAVIRGDGNAASVQFFDERFRLSFAEEVFFGVNDVRGGVFFGNEVDGGAVGHILPGSQIFGFSARNIDANARRQTER